MRDETIKETPNEDIANFLSELSKLVREDRLNEKQIQLIGEFYLNYLFNSDIEVDDEEHDKREEGDVDKNELMKFLSLGWYMYTFLIKNKSSEEEKEETL